MSKNLMSNVQQAELQGQLRPLLEKFRAKHGLSPAAIFDFLVCYAWGDARTRNASGDVVNPRDAASTEQIVNRMRAGCEACEVALQRATGSMGTGIMPPRGQS